MVVYLIYTCVTGVAQLARNGGVPYIHMCYRCGTIGHVWWCILCTGVLQVWHNWPCNVVYLMYMCVTGVAQLALYGGVSYIHMCYRCGTIGQEWWCTLCTHVLQVWHNWPCMVVYLIYTCVTGVAQLAMYGGVSYIYVCYRCDTIDHVWRCTLCTHVLQVWHNWPGMVVYLCTHVLQVWHNWPGMVVYLMYTCVTGVAQLALYGGVSYVRTDDNAPYIKVKLCSVCRSIT